MESGSLGILKKRLDGENYDKLVALKNKKLFDFVAEQIEWLDPAKVSVITDDEKDVDYVRNQAIEKGEEERLATKGHSIHFDNYYDQARDKEHTRILVPKGVDLGRSINTFDRDQGLSEIKKIMKGIMRGKELFVRFFCLGPLASEFSILCVQLTDSAYVAHNEDLLYRRAYEEFRNFGENAGFFRLVHSAGELEGSVSKNLDKRRVYIDLQDNIVYSANTQYGGNTIGLKKLAMRLAIRKASKEGWLTEHMFVMGVNGPGRVTYFTGAFPSMCGKTSTAMLDGESIVGDDIAYLRKREGKIYAVNVETGIFGIVKGVNSRDDPLIWKAVTSPSEVIFSNVLLTPNRGVYWIDKDDSVPEKGFNHSGEWFLGKKDSEENEVTPSHKNARFTINLKSLENVDPELDNPEGVEVGGVIYGGRDSETSVPVEEAFDWEHGIITKGASLESETTAATLGQEGVKKFNPMSNLDFLSIPIGRYVKNNLDFGIGLEKTPKIFSVNYFLKGKDGEFLNKKTDKRVWLKWMELRVHGDVDAIRTPTGLIPKYEDLSVLFEQVGGRKYTEKEYAEEFTLRVNENIEKIERILEIYQTVPEAPKRLFSVLESQKKRLLEAREKQGEYVSPLLFAEEN